MSTFDIYEEWRKGFSVGYYYGRIDALMGRDYDDSTPKERGSDDTANSENENELGGDRFD